jgi:hypothetical protein
MSADENYCAFIADIVKSTKMDEADRYNAQKELEASIELYNSKYNKAIAARIDFSAGDQLQALFLNPCDAYEFSCDFRERLFPIQFKIGLGVGNWSLRFPDSSTNKQDGVSYQNARQAFDYAHRLNKSIAFFSNRDEDPLINVLVSQEYAIFNSQSLPQKNMFREYKNMFPIQPAIKKDRTISIVNVNKGSQKSIAEKLASTRQNVNKLVRKGLIYEQRDLQGAIILLLAKIFEEKVI